MTTRRVLVTGSRNWTDTTTITAVLRRWAAPGVVLVHGGARGADRIAAGIWRAWGLPVEEHRADWDRHRRRAGYVRNAHMVAAGATACLAFSQDHSRGATHCADTAETAGIPTHRYRHTTYTSERTNR